MKPSEYDHDGPINPVRVDKVLVSTRVEPSRPMLSSPRAPTIEHNRSIFDARGRKWEVSVDRLVKL